MAIWSELAAELVRLRVDVIVTGTNIHVAAVRGATTAIPIVMVFRGRSREIRVRREPGSVGWKHHRPER
jgi:hypothetical protein